MIDIINLWFKKAVPNPTPRNVGVQTGVHYEEVSEMLQATGDIGMSLAMANLASVYKAEVENVYIEDKVALLDALCDQIVTAVGTAYMNGFDIVGALKEVNSSNWSKFDNGEPIFDENGKIKKGPNYRPPDLTNFV